MNCHACGRSAWCEVGPMQIPCCRSVECRKAARLVLLKTERVETIARLRAAVSELSALETAIKALALILALALVSCAHPADRRPRAYSLDSGSGERR